MNILVTGGSGFIGSHLIEALRKKTRHHVRALVRTNLGFLDIKGIELIKGDLRDINSLKIATKNIDMVINLAAVEYGATEKELFMVNYCGVKNLIKASVRNGVKYFIHCSSAGVHGYSDKIINEKSPLRPFDKYHLYKLKGELALKNYKNHLKILILRPSLVYGPRNLRAFRKLMNSIAKNKIILFYRPRERMQGIIYVEDLVNVFLRALEMKAAGVYIASSENVSFGKMVDTIKNLLHADPLIFYVPTLLVKVIGYLIRKKRETTYPIIKNMVYDNSKIRKELGFRPKVSLEEGLRKTLIWYKSNNLM
jgi:nucleoside-diphosphate-sugar epimerase